jgi:hypothetical protein
MGGMYSGRMKYNVLKKMAKKLHSDVNKGIKLTA